VCVGATCCLPHIFVSCVVPRPICLPPVDKRPDGEHIVKVTKVDSPQQLESDNDGSETGERSSC
jgi:hypothetical protein